ncbi:hypothetical protein B0T16DRAFT_144386 [Cercophora newfieldiana]|uniref:Uncharacterized protein n=1 Tax=Cercophora newfieldiana TaxID=92897 RepID=A0AA40CQ98_9PEZI|nr:hypothetical protein B0T16DRAFT_144386 [Cercophora newfieldiana]
MGWMGSLLPTSTQETAVYAIRPLATLVLSFVAVSRCQSQLGLHGGLGESTSLMSYINMEDNTFEYAATQTTISYYLEQERWSDSPMHGCFPVLLPSVQTRVVAVRVTCESVSRARTARRKL